MLRSLRSMLNYQINAKNEVVGEVEDFFFDDHQWVVRYIVDRLGAFTDQKHLLVSPRSVKSFDWVTKSITTDLTKAQIEKSPDVNAHKPISFQQQDDLAKYFNWPLYAQWGMDSDFGRTNRLENNQKALHSVAQKASESADDFLRSAQEVQGYHIHALDGEIGRVDDFIIEDDSWSIRYMAIATHHWTPGRKVLISPHWIHAIRWNDAEVVVNLDRKAVKNSPEFNPHELINRQYEETLYDYYGRPFYWR